MRRNATCADDIDAVIIIALFHASGIAWNYLAIAAVILLLLIGSNVMGVHDALLYVMLEIFLWIAFLHTGIHAAVAGVLLAMTIQQGQVSTKKNLSRRLRSR